MTAVRRWAVAASLYVVLAANVCAMYAWVRWTLAAPPREDWLSIVSAVHGGLR